MTKEQFVAVLCEIFEHSPWVAEQVFDKIPFSDVNELHRVMVVEVSKSNISYQIALLKSHPQLAGKEAIEGDLTSSSKTEQSSAKLDCLSHHEMTTINRFNQEYMTKFGFPFIIAVLNHTKESIFSEFDRRLKNDGDAERITALEQVAYIAGFRLDAIFKSN